MNDQDKPKEQLITEFGKLRQPVAELEASLVTLKERAGAGQEAEATCKAMIEAFDGLVYVCSPNHEVEFMNVACKRTAGLTEKITGLEKKPNP